MYKVFSVNLDGLAFARKTDAPLSANFITIEKLNVKLCDMKVFGIFTVNTQILIGVVVALGFANTGGGLVFPSIISSDAESNSTNIYGYPFKLSSTEKDMIGSLYGIGAIVGTILFSIVSNVWGRKVVMLWSGLIDLVSWWAISLSPNTTGIIIARICSGVSNGGVSVVCMNYVSEMANIKVRGLLCSLNSAFVTLGFLWTILLGYWFKYYTVCFINSLFPLGLAVGQLLLPESHKFLTITGKIEEAKKSLRIVRKSDEEQIEKEILQCIEMNKSQKSNKETFMELLQLKMIKRMLVVGVLFMIRSCLGNEVLTVNSTRIFSMLGGDKNAEIYSIVLSVFAIISLVVASFFLIDGVGRKKSMYISLSVGVLGTFTLAVCSFFVAVPEGSSSLYNLEQENISLKLQEATNLSSIAFNSTEFIKNQINQSNWILVVISRISVIVATFGFGLGVRGVPFVVNAEYFPTWLRSQTSCLGSVCFMVTYFIALQTFTPLLNLLSLGGYFLAITILLLMCFPFIRFCLEETMKKEVG